MYMERQAATSSRCLQRGSAAAAAPPHLSDGPSLVLRLGVNVPFEHVPQWAEVLYGYCGRREFESFSRRIFLTPSLLFDACLLAVCIQSKVRKGQVQFAGYAALPSLRSPPDT